jgi:arginase
MAQLNIFSSCCKAGQPKGGVELAPVVLLSKIRDIISRNSLNLNAYNKFINNDEFENDDGYQNLYELNLESFQNTLNLGGDHSIALSTVKASATKYREQLKVIWVDAHADLNTFDSSFSKNKHGMPLSPVFKLMNPWIKVCEEQYYINPSQLVYIGLRSVDPPEKEFIEKLGIRVYYIEEVMEKGIQKVMEEILKDDEDSEYHLSFDIDGIDPKYMPSTGTAEENGLSLNDGKHIIRTLLNTQRLRVFDFVELNPSIGSIDEQLYTADNCAELLEIYVQGISGQ